VAQPPKLSDFMEGAARIAEARVGTSSAHAGRRSPGSQPTSAYLSYDDNLYVVFVCVGDPRLVRAHIAKRKSSQGTTA
jgi:hypothetical protein